MWLFNAAHADGLLVGFYDAAVELPLNAAAVAGDSLPITVTLNTTLVTVNTPVTGLGLLKSYLMICPNQDVPQQARSASTRAAHTRCMLRAACAVACKHAC